MTKLINPKILLPILVSAFVFVACSKDEDKGVESLLLTSEETLLQYVPADTPYIFANIAPLPDDLMDKLEPRIDRVLQSYQAVLQGILTSKQQELSDEERDNEELQRVTAVADALMSLLSLEGMRGAGFGRE